MLHETSGGHLVLPTAQSGSGSSRLLKAVLSQVLNLSKDGILSTSSLGTHSSATALMILKQ